MDNEKQVTDEAGQVVSVGDVVQINPEHDDRFGACLMTVSELKPTWGGLMGYVRIPGSGEAYYRVPGKNVKRIGKAEWAVIA